MRAVVSRVDRARCEVDGQVTGQTGPGLLVYVGVMIGDSEQDADWLADKLVSLRIFNDDAGKMNRSVIDIGGGLLLIPNFTLAGRTKTGTRPSFSDAAPPEIAQPLFQRVVDRCGQTLPTGAGVFGAHMMISSLANGPVTVMIDSKQSNL